MRDMVGSYLETLSRATRDAECTSAGGERMTLSAGSLLVSHLCHSAHDSGGKVMHGPMEVPGGGWIVQAADPQGATFALLGSRK